MTASQSVAFVSGFEGPWRIDGIAAPRGESLAPAARLAQLEGADAEGADGRWVLRGLAGAAAAGSAPLGRPEARVAALVAVRKSQAWRDMTAAERGSVLGEGSHELAMGGAHPTIARRLYRSHDPGEPFDLLGWFEHAPDDEGAFNELLAGLTASDEWAYVERQVTIHLSR
ncbi:MAG: chlorite dismutase [Acidimicrobiales bacterium]|nr:MAG: chlorite dismutase [Acidimicrobiales bacterium]